jgi:hypothetical protein
MAGEESVTKLRVEQTAKIEITGSGTVKTLKELLDKIPENATTTIVTSRAAYDTYENYIRFDWSEEL